MSAPFQVGWAGRFPDKATRLTTFDFEARRWRELGYPVWPVFTHGEPHSSDCALHNEPAKPAEPCDCGGAAAGVPPSDAIEQSLGLYFEQAEAIRELLDQHAPWTTGNLQARIAQLCLCIVPPAHGVLVGDHQSKSRQTPMDRKEG